MTVEELPVGDEAAQGATRPDGSKKRDAATTRQRLK